jgi:phosphohistidine phosphatase
MKYIYLVRHAKSSWEKFSVPDFERPLNDRGKRDAPVMATRLKDRDIHIDLFVSSPAKRARKTAILFLGGLGMDKRELKLVPGLYLAGPSVFQEIIAGLDDSCQSAALFAHNPGITDFANLLTDVRIDNMPTSSIFGVKAETNTWAGFDSSRKEFLFFDFPKSGAE